MPSRYGGRASLCEFRKKENDNRTDEVWSYLTGFVGFLCNIHTLSLLKTK